MIELLTWSWISLNVSPLMSSPAANSGEWGSLSPSDTYAMGPRLPLKPLKGFFSGLLS